MGGDERHGIRSRSESFTRTLLRKMMPLADIPLIDQHAHNLLKAEIFSAYAYSAAFTEGYDPKIVNYHARHTLCYRRSLRDIAALLDCEPSETEIIQQREQLGLEKLT